MMAADNEVLNLLHAKCTSYSKGEKKMQQIGLKNTLYFAKKLRYLLEIYKFFVDLEIFPEHTLVFSSSLGTAKVQRMNFYICDCIKTLQADRI